MILADDIGKFIGAELVSERPRSIAVEAAGREKRRSVLPRSRTHPLNITEIC
jgi:hypothetical protein